MLTLTSEYALRAMIYLTRHDGECHVPGWRIAEHAAIPPKYLSKILSDLVRCGVLKSSRGKTGGFRMRRSPRCTSLHEILKPFEQHDNRRCPFGNDRCGGEHPCLAHDNWSKVIEAKRRFLGETTIYDVAIPKERESSNVPCAPDPL